MPDSIKANSIPLRIGVDLGGTKIEVIAMDGEGLTLARRRIATPREDYQATLDAIAALVVDVEGALGQRGTVGVAMPGTLLSATGRVKNANSTWLNGRALDRDLQELLGRPLRFANDANCFTLSEATDGAAAGAAVVFGVIVGTGTGGGIVVNGQVLSGRNGICGEWGHNPLPWPRPDEQPGPECYCGRRGCIETWLSGPGLTRDHRAHGGDQDNAADIAAVAERDWRAKYTLHRYVGRMTRALASIVNVLDPDVIVLGGGLSALSLLYEEIPRRWGQYVFSDRIETRLVPPQHGDASGVRGAAWLWPAVLS